MLSVNHDCSEPPFRLSLKAVRLSICNFKEWDGTAGKETDPSMYNRDRTGQIKPLHPYRCKKYKGRTRNEVCLVVLCKRCKRVLWDTGQLTQHKGSVRTFTRRTGSVRKKVR